MSNRAEAVAVRDLDADGLWYSRRRVTDEILRAVRTDADHDALDRMLTLLDAIDRRPRTYGRGVAA